MLVRLIEGVSGTVDLRMTLAARFEYGSARPRFRQHDEALGIVAGPDRDRHDGRAGACRLRRGCRGTRLAAGKQPRRVRMAIRAGPARLSRDGARRSTGQAGSCCPPVISAQMMNTSMAITISDQTG